MGLFVKVAVLSIVLVLLVSVQTALGDYSMGDYSKGVQGSQGDYSLGDYSYSIDGHDYSHGRVKRQHGPAGSRTCLPLGCQRVSCKNGNCGFWCKACGISG